MGEGEIYALIGFLYRARQLDNPETTNCQLTGAENTDFHIDIGFDKTFARKIRNNEQLTTDETTALKQTSIVVEMTPHYRAQHQPRWTLTQVKKALGKQVKVIGQLIIDNEHADPSQNCGSPDANEADCDRGSAWELHPVTQFFVCSTSTPCSRNSPNWVKLADLQ